MVNHEMQSYILLVFRSKVFFFFFFNSSTHGDKPQVEVKEQLSQASNFKWRRLSYPVSSSGNYTSKNRKTPPQDIFPPKSLAKCVVVCVIARRKPNLLKRVLCFQTVCDRQSQKPGGGTQGGLVCRPPPTLWLLCLLSLLRRNLNAIKETQCCFLSPSNYQLLRFSLV